MKKDLILDERELKEIQHALYYYRYLRHGTVGHNLLMLLGKIADSMGFYLDTDEEIGYPDHDHADLLMFDGEPGVKELKINASS